MQAQAAPVLWELILFWFFTGSSLVGLPPGERDLRLISAVPPQTIAYFEWASPGPGQLGATGIDGFVADPEVRQFLEQLDAALMNRAATEVDDSETEQALHFEVLQFARQVLVHPGCLFLLGYESGPMDKPDVESWSQRLLRLQAGAILSMGDDSDAAWANLRRILNSVPGFSRQESAPTQQIPLSFPGYQLVVHREDNRIVFAIGASTLPRIIEGLSGKAPGLDTNPTFRKAVSQIAIDRISSIGWIDGQGMVTTVASLLGPMETLVRPMLTLIGADGLDRAIICSGVDQGTMIQRAFVATGGRTNGILALFSGTPIQPDHFNHISADADLVLAASINLKNVYQEARQLLANTQPHSVSAFDEAVKLLEAELELKIVNDVLGAFGDVVTAFDSPSAGGIIATSLVISLEVRDSRKAEAVFDRLMKLAELSLAADPTEVADEFSAIHRQQFLGHTIYFINRSGPGYGAQWTLSPSFCLTERRLLFAIHPQAMKAQLRFLDSQRQEVQSSKRLSFDQIGTQRTSMPTGETLVYCYLNGPRATGLISAILPYVSPTILLRLEVEGVSLDPFDIPSAAAITPYFGDSTAVLARQKDGLLLETRNAAPLIISWTLLQLYQSWNSLGFDILEDEMGGIVPLQER